MKTNGMRMDSSSGGAPLIGGTFAGTPESITLSVDSLSQRQIYKGPPQNLQPSTHHPTWKRSPIVDITQDSVIAAANSSEYPPTQVKTATKNIPIILTKVHSSFFNISIELHIICFRLPAIRMTSMGKGYQPFNEETRV